MKIYFAYFKNLLVQLFESLIVEVNSTNTFIVNNILFFAFQRRHGLDANRYATKKTIAQGMLDVALLTANASQLKYVLQLGDKHPFYELMLSLIVISIILQVRTKLI